VNIGIGSKVKEGDVLCVVEAMKMEIDVLSDREGIVEESFIYPGCSIAEGDIMMEIVDEDSTSIVGEGKTQPWIMDDEVNGNIVSSFCGMVVRVAVEVGDEVRKGDVVCVVEVMKLQSDILANRDGIVEEIMVGPGDFVQEDEILMVIK
jgi:biotin carboxyl carrier protein